MRTKAYKGEGSVVQVFLTFCLDPSILSPFLLSFLFSGPWYFCGSFYTLLSVHLSFFSVTLLSRHYRSSRPVIAVFSLDHFSVSALF